jgi:hypothetical protein
MGILNAKKRWTTIYWQWHVNKFLKKSHEVTRMPLIFKNDARPLSEHHF